MFFQLVEKNFNVFVAFFFVFGGVLWGMMRLVLFDFLPVMDKKPKRLGKLNYLKRKRAVLELFGKP
jgi:hypothetical protein